MIFRRTTAAPPTSPHALASRVGKRYFYTNARGELLGPLDYGELVVLHKRGILNGDTPIRNGSEGVPVKYRFYEFPEAAAAEAQAKLPKQTSAEARRAGEKRLLSRAAVILIGIVAFYLIASTWLEAKRSAISATAAAPSPSPARATPAAPSPP
ncbi:hypothetical protein DB346_18970 [Verrucomicrobia bacterium LW23]|nr:hypothetical protein DB346_18970 [Verrucomicrobia bacterium LW23]